MSTVTRAPRLPGLLEAVAVAPAPGRRVATGKAVPTSAVTEVRLDVGRGSYLQAAVVACAHCDAVLALLAEDGGGAGPAPRVGVRPWRVGLDVWGVQRMSAEMRVASCELACSDTEPRMGRDGRWRWTDEAGNQFPCQLRAVRRLTRAAFENVLGEIVPSYTLQYCAEHWSEAWESEPGITVEVVGQAVLL